MRPPPRSLRFVAKALLCGRLSRPPPRSALFPTRHNSAAQPISCTTATRGVRSSPPPRRRFHPSDLDHRDLALVVGIVVGEVRQRPAGCSPRAARPRPACALPACAPIALTRASTPPAAVILAWLSALSLTNFARALQPCCCTPTTPRCARIAPTTVSIPDAVILALLWASSPAQCNTAARPCSLRALPCREQDLRVPLRLQRRNAALKRRRRRGVECV